MSNIKAVIFDMDGVLVDAKDWHYEALNRALNLYGHNITREEHLSIYDGLPTKKKLELLAENHNFDIPLHQVINDLKQMYTLDLVKVYCAPNPGHIDALSRLKKEGYKLGLASNSVRNSVETMMERCELTPYLDVMLSNEDVIHAKPHPEIYLTAAEKLGVLPEECFVLEDNKNGIDAAQAAGCNVLVVETINDVTYDNIKVELNKYSPQLA